MVVGVGGGCECGSATWTQASSAGASSPSGTASSGAAGLSSQKRGRVDGGAEANKEKGRAPQPA